MKSCAKIQGQVLTCIATAHQHSLKVPPAYREFGCASRTCQLCSPRRPGFQFAAQVQHQSQAYLNPALLSRFKPLVTASCHSPARRYRWLPLRVSRTALHVPSKALWPRPSSFSSSKMSAPLATRSLIMSSLSMRAYWMKRSQSYACRERQVGIVLVRGWGSRLWLVNGAYRVVFLLV